MAEDLLHWGMGAAGLFVAWRIWTGRIKPWVTDKIESAQSDPGQALVTVGDVGVSAADALGGAVLLAVVLGAVLILRRRPAKKQRDGEQP